MLLISLLLGLALAQNLHDSAIEGDLVALQHAIDTGDGLEMGNEVRQKEFPVLIPFCRGSLHVIVGWHDSAALSG